jgi:hypothetical protein
MALRRQQVRDQEETARDDAAVGQLVAVSRLAEPNE